MEKQNSVKMESLQNDFNTAITWWERKRLVYNIITLFGALLVIFGRGEVPNGISSYKDFVIVFYWLFGANVFYTFGWGFEAILNYYFKTPFFGKTTRTLCFFLGAFFSLVWMFILASQIN